jgi:hypothetical protein
MTTKKERIWNEIHYDGVMDAFFGSTRICKYCKTPTEWDSKKAVRYCPKGCFKGEIKKWKRK